MIAQALRIKAKLQILLKMTVLCVAILVIQSMTWIEKLHSAKKHRKPFSHLQALCLNDDLFKEAMTNSFLVRHVGDVMQGQSMFIYSLFPNCLCKILLLIGRFSSRQHYLATIRQPRCHFHCCSQPHNAFATIRESV